MLKFQSGERQHGDREVTSEIKISWFYLRSPCAMSTPRADSNSSVRGGFTTLSTLGRTAPSTTPKSFTRNETQTISSPEQNCRSSSPESCVHDGSNNPLREQQKGNNPNDLLQNDIYLAVFASSFSNFSKRVGIAYLDVETEEIHLGEFIDPDGFTLNSMKSRLSPKVIITQARPDDDFFKLLQRDCDGNEPVLYNVQTIRRSEFNYDGSLHRLKMLHIRELDGTNYSESTGVYLPGTSEISQTMKLLSLVSFEKRNMICALGGLLSYIQKNNVINQLDERSLPLTISAIKHVELTDTVMIDDTTLRALSICHSDVHPVGSTNGKEGLSVFKMLDETRTSQGKKLLRAWLLAPTTNLDVLHARQNAISALLDPRNEHWFAEITLRISSVKDLKRLLTKFENIRTTYYDWVYLTESIQQLISLRELANSDNTKFCLLSIVKEMWDDEIVELNNLITSVIDFTESKLSKRLEIRHGLSPELDKMKYSYEQLDVFLTSVAQDLVASSSINFQHLEVLQLPQLGHLIAIPLDPKRAFEDQKSIPSFEFQFFAEDKLFFKNDRTRELDQEIGDIRGVILDVEASFIRELSERVLACKSHLLKLSRVVAEIDCLLSLAKAAVMYNLTRPQFIQQTLLEIRNGFHLVKAQTVDQFIPNDVYLDADHSSKPIILITGPNRSGKSILLKQIGIIVYLAHCGSFVPAESTTLGLVDQIFCRIDLQETSMSSLSTFATDCNQISRMLRHATSSSLLLIDEFGKGTCKEDGIALLTSVIHYFGSRCADKTPLAIIITHFHELFTLKLLPDSGHSSSIAVHKMDVIAKIEEISNWEDFNGIEDRVTFLYKLVPGISMNSYGLECAAMAGFPSEIVNRARQISQAYINQQPIHKINEDGIGYEKLYESFYHLDLSDNRAVGNFIETLMTLQ